MHFSEKEIIIIKHIDSGKIFNLLNYLEVMVPLKIEINTRANGLWGNLRIPQGTAVKMVEDEDALAKELLAFLALCKKLERVYLLQTLDNATYTLLPPMLVLKDHDVAGANQIANIFSKNTHFAIVPFNELTQFIENKFLTSEEINLKQERLERISGQETTIRSTKWTLGVSVAISVVTAGFNYWAYTNERKVSIVNLDAIKYPIPVSITELPKLIEVTTNVAPKDLGKKSQICPGNFLKRV